MPLQRKQFENCFESGCDVDKKSWIDPSVIISLQRAPSLIFSAQQHFCEDHGLDKKDDLGHNGDGDVGECDDDDVAGDCSDMTLMTEEEDAVVNLLKPLEFLAQLPPYIIPSLQCARTGDWLSWIGHKRGLATG